MLTFEEAVACPYSFSCRCPEDCDECEMYDEELVHLVAAAQPEPSRDLVHRMINHTFHTGDTVLKIKYSERVPANE